MKIEVYILLLVMWILANCVFWGCIIVRQRRRKRILKGAGVYEKEEVAQG